MSTNGTNVEDSEMAECDGEKVVTMMDVLQEQQDFEDDANAVLGASDDKNCTYNKGYIKRQAVYACLTCCNDAKHDPEKRAGVCLACSLTCHENHDLVELYTKRNFCCDCGNPKFNHPCQYTQNKTTLNEDNIYNQNFSGLYCICHRPYPDPDGVEEEMIQCIVCEDWLHASHLEATVPSSELYAEMICKACMEKNEFLHDYGKYAVNGDVDVVDINEIADSSIQCNGDTSKVNGVDEEAAYDEAERKETKVSCDMEINTNHTESVNTSHDNIDENKTEEQMQPKESVSDKTTDKNPVEESQVKDVVLDKSDNENPADENQPESEVSDKADNENFADENQPESEVSDKANNEHLADENQPESEVSDKADNENPADENQPESEVSDKANNENPADENQPESEVSDKADNENPADENQPESEVSDKADNENRTEENQAQDKNEEQNPDSDEISDLKSSDNLPNERDAEVISAETKDESTTSNKDDDITDAVDANIAEQNEHVNSADIPQEPNGGVSGDQQTNIQTDLKEIELNGDSQDKQEELADSNIMSAADTSVPMDESSHANDNHVSLEDEQIKESKRKLSTEELTDESSIKKKAKFSDNACLRPKGEKKMFKGATFWPSHFRQKLCTCNECSTMYKDLSVLFLIDPEDTVTAYETLGKEKSDGTASTQYEKGLEALSSLGRIQQINALTEYNKMRDKLLDFLKSFKDRKEVVKEEDIKAFFAGMKPKREPDGVYFCR